MTTAYPPELVHLLDASDVTVQVAAWEKFLAQHSRLMLHTVRQTSHGYDETMDRYTFVLEKLRAEDYRRLRAYASDGRTRFTTWLVVVVRRLCIDHHRTVFGRPRTEETTEAITAKRDLAELVTSRLDVQDLPGSPDLSPERQLRAKQLSDCLQGAISDLTPRDRLMIRLRFDDELSVKESSR